MAVRSGKNARNVVGTFQLNELDLLVHFLEVVAALGINSRHFLLDIGFGRFLRVLHTQEEVELELEWRSFQF